MGKVSGDSALPALNAMALVMNGVGGHIQTDRTRKQAEEARLAEIKGKEAERLQRKENRNAEQTLDEKQRRAQARSKALWGRAGVAMSGSPLAVQFGRKADDNRRMNSLLSEGQDRLDAIGESARHKAEEARRQASLRAGSQYPLGSSAGLLSLGAKAFDDDSLGSYSPRVDNAWQATNELRRSVVGNKEK